MDTYKIVSYANGKNTIETVVGKIWRCNYLLKWWRAYPGDYNPIGLNYGSENIVASGDVFGNYWEGCFPYHPYMGTVSFRLGEDRGYLVGCEPPD